MDRPDYLNEMSVEFAAMRIEESREAIAKIGS